MISSLFQQALNFQPIGETLNPVVGGKVLLSHTEAKNAPPGQMTTAVPFAFAGSAGKTVSVGLATLKTTRVCHRLVRFSFSSCFQFSEPGAGPS